MIGDRSTEAEQLAADGLVDHVVSVIHERVLSGEMAVGTKLRQEALARELGISRTPVREALHKLHARRIVDFTPNRGAVVVGLSARDIRDAYEVRAELEGFAAELASQRITDAALTRLREAEALFRESIATWVALGGEAPVESESGASWTSANDLFHRVIHEAADNDRLRQAIHDLHVSFPRNLTWSALSASAMLLEENVEEHRAILDAIARRDAAASRALMAEHVRRSGALVARRHESLR